MKLLYDRRRWHSSTIRSLITQLSCQEEFYRCCCCFIFAAWLHLTRFLIKTTNEQLLLVFIITRCCLYCKCEWVVIVQTLFYCQQHVIVFQTSVSFVCMTNVVDEGKIMKHVDNNYTWDGKIVVSLLMILLIF